MIENKILLLNKQGFIPGPKEEEEGFLQRVQLTQELFKNPSEFLQKYGKRLPFKFKDPIKKPSYSWANALLNNLFNFKVDNFLGYFENYSLGIFQGAATWIIDFGKISLPILQLRKGLKKGRVFKIYSLEDIIAHELVHFARVGFDEPQYEEFFAYATSSSIIRKTFGPIVTSPKETYLIVGIFSLGICFHFFHMIFGNGFLNLSFFVSQLSIAFLSLFGIGRLIKRKMIFNKCFKKLFKIFKDKKKVMYIMFRLTDREIKTFAKISPQEIWSYAEDQTSLRWKVIYQSYFI